jgi:outer membrane protein insertion porin family
MISSKSISAGDTPFRLIVFFALLFIFFIQPAFADLKVKKIIFQGNNSFKTSELKPLLKTKEGDSFDNKIYRLDRIILTNYYLSRGFLNIWIESEVERTGENLDVIFNISEGKRYHFGGITFSGVTLLTEIQLMDLFNLSAGDIFQMKLVEEGLNKLEDFYFNHGKPYVEITDEQVVKDSLVYFNIKIIENETVYIHELRYTGLREVKRFIIGREIIITAGDVYSRSDIEKSQKNIYSTGLFDFVGMELRAIDSTRSRAELLVKVVEKKSKWVGVRFGVGYEQEIVFGGTFDFTLEFGHRNLFGTARSIYLNAIPSFSYDFDEKRITNPKNQFSFNYVEPWIGYTRTPGIFRISFIQARPLYAANYDFFSSSFTVQHEFENNWKISGVLAYSRVQILAGDSLDNEFYQLTKGQDFIYSISSRMSKDKRDNYLNPSSGFLTDFEIKFAYVKTRDNPNVMDPNNIFVKMVGEWSRFQSFPLQRKWILASRIKLGNIFLLNPESTVPVSDRFYLGGSSTVRGYKEQLLGPVIVDSTKVNPTAVGGKFFVLANLELRIPIVWLFWGEIFVDIGNVWGEFDITDNTSQTFDQDIIRKQGGIVTTSGIGIALLTPLGPVRLDYGLKHRVESYQSSGEFHIGIAFAF